MSMDRFAGFSRTALSVAVAIVAAAPVMAQNTTAGISGRVTNAAGSPVAGASVAIKHNESGSVNSATTDGDGRYAARGLRAGGPYTITISKGGQTESREGVFLSLAETLAFDATLGEAAATVVVTGQGGASKFNSGSMGSGTNISGAQLNALASIQRNLQDYARTDPRVAQTDKERGEISAGGQNSRYNSITIDGVNISDTFGLEGNNLPTLKQPISIDAIQSVQVNLSNYDVTQKGYTGANINAVTKSGTNEWHGAVYYVFRNDQLAGDRWDRIKDDYFLPPAFKETTKGVSIGGPIIKDKLFLFANYEELKSSRGAPVFGPVGSPLQNVAITPSSIASFQAVAKSKYGIDIGTLDVPSGAEVVVKDKLIKLDWNISDNHRANIRYTKTDQTEPIFSNFSTSSLGLTSNWYNQGKAVETKVAQLFADWTPEFSTELKLSRRDYDSAAGQRLTLPQIELNFQNAAAHRAGQLAHQPLFAGTERSRQFNQLFTTTDDLYLGGTLTLGGHEIKAGSDYTNNKIFNAFLQDVYGNYTFRCVNSSTTFTYNSLPGGINCATASQADNEKALLENFERGRASVYQVQAPFAGKTLQDGVARWSIADTGLFLQDTFKVNKNLTLNAGVRMDKLSVPDKPIANAAAAAPMVAGNAATNTRQSGGFGLDNSVTVDGESLVQPRLGFNLRMDTEDKRKMQLRGGIGLFQGAAATVWLSNPFSNTGVATRFVGCGGSFSACPTTDGLFNADPNNQPTTFGGSPPAAGVDFIQPGMAQPSVWKANLAFDAELPWYGLTAGAEWMHTKNKLGIFYQQLNLGTVTRTGPDGRELYYNANGYNTNCWTATGGTTTGTGCGGSVTSKALSNSAFANVTLASKSSLGGGDAFTLSLSQQPTRELGWQLAVTRTTATEVSPLTSSVANSNFNSRSIFNPNEEVAANSAYLIKNRISAALTWSKAFFGDKKTTVGLFYEGRTGHTYSWTFNNDLNGDGVAGNDLMYIPSKPGSGEVVFAGGAADEARFWDTVYRSPELNKSMGKVTSRNGSHSPWVNNFDLRVSQELPGLKVGHKGAITFDILNVGNLLNPSWGRIDEVLFQSAGGAARSFVNYKGLDANGKYIYSTMSAVESLETRQVKGESQWAVQITLKYEF
ncbi:MAG: carboxypeptidase regulatory-like domain-containing protein [Ideonella sp.]|nr:carboxypeptidase regulatory-like domain-containing protein [Ideonella sp.]